MILIPICAVCYITGKETFLPERLLYGTLPSSLLEQYLFWQDEADNLRGYPKSKENEPYVIYITLHQNENISLFTLNNTFGSIQRVLRKPIEERLKNQTNLLSFIFKTNLITNKEDEKIDFQLMFRLGRIVDQFVNQAELNDFIDALILSGVQYDNFEILISEIESFGSEQEPMQIDGSILNTSLELSELTLVNTLYASPACKTFSVTSVLTRMENEGHILVWSKGNGAGRNANAEVSLDLIELRRLKLSFHEKFDDNNVLRLFSMDFSNLFVSNFNSELTQELTNGAPHSVLMSSCNNELQVLVPVIDAVRPRISGSPFSTELVMNRNECEEWLASLEQNYFLYPVHVSLSFLFSTTLSSAIYLLLLRFLHRQYHDVFRLCEAISTGISFYYFLLSLSLSLSGTVLIL